MSAWTYDLATAVGQVRLLTDDRDLSAVGDDLRIEKRSAVWTDEELQFFLDQRNQSVYYAAATALTQLAANRSLLVQSRRIGNTTVDYGSARDALLKLADRYIQIALGSIDPEDGIAAIAWTPFNERRIIYDTMIRTDE